LNNATTVIVDHLLPIRREVSNISRSIISYRLGEARHMLSTNEAAIAAEDATLIKLSKTIDSAFEKAANMIGGGDASAPTLRTRAAWQDYVQGEQALLAISRANKDDEALKLFTKSGGRFVEIQGKVDELIKATTTDADQYCTDCYNNYMNVSNITIAIVGIILFFSSCAAWYFERNVTRAILRLAGCMARIADGDLATEVVGYQRSDELGAMAKTVQTFKENGIAMRKAEQEAELQRQAASDQRAKADAEREAAAAERASAEAERARLAAEREAAAARQAEAMEALADGLAQLAAGNLTVALETPFEPEYERVRVDFNAAVAGVQNTVREIMGHTAAIGTGIGEISTASDDLARRTEQQAASLEQTAAALDEITGRVKGAAASSGEAQAIATAAQQETEASERVVTEAVTAMGEIEGSARKIGQIIGVIDEIAFQTNLLALNAGVEAARAGEAGRGFAVVASEVRALAQRAADAAKEIKTLVTNSMRQVERGVRLVGDTGAALARIQLGVGRINSAIGEIAASAKEQANGLAEVNIAVNEMDRVTQQNAGMVEQSTSSVHALSQETEALNEAMSRFQIAHSSMAQSSAHSSPAHGRQGGGPRPAKPIPQRASGRNHAAHAAAVQEDFDGF
jgi:methyl-accepting chemotaxis protein